MAPLSAAERSRLYRQRNKEKVHESDALRKRYKRTVMKATDPEKNRERLRKQRIYKIQYREKIKAAIEQDALSRPSASVSTPAFSQRSTQMRSLKKAEKALPRSPNKKKAVVASLCKKFQLRIVPQNRGRKKQELNEDEIAWLTEFLDRPVVSLITPGKNDHVYVGKVDGKKQFLQKRYLLWTLRDLLDIANGCSVVNQDDLTFVGSFEHKLSFRQLYGFIKSRKQYIYNKDIPHSACLCEICENATYFMKGLNQKLPKENQLPANPHDIVERFSCDSSSEVCMSSKCEKCKEISDIDQINFDSDTVVFNE